MLKFAVSNLLSRPVRSALSLLGLTVAIVGMVGLFSVARGLEQTVDRTFARIPGLSALQPGAPLPLFSTLPAAWGEEIAQVPGVRVVVPEIWQRVNVIDGRAVVSPPRFLLGIDLPARNQLETDVFRECLEAGRFLTLEDRGTLNCLISRPIAEEFVKEVGDGLWVGDFELTIVGVYYCDSMLLDVAILLDIDQVRTITRFDPGSVSNFYIEPTNEVGNEELALRITSAFRGREIEPWRPSSLLPGGEPIENPLAALVRRLDRALKSPAGETDPVESPHAPVNSVEGADDLDGEGQSADRRNAEHPGEAGPAGSNAEPPEPTARRPLNVATAPLEVRTAQDWTEQFDQFTEDLNVFLFLVTGIGVLIAVLSIINTMVMSVTERVIEFGVLKANGWSSLNVMKLVAFESAVLGFAGGVLGGTIGWLATHAINAHWPDRVNLYASPGLLLFALGFSTLLGVLGGLYPALWAMRLMPIDAIRRG